MNNKSCLWSVTCVCVESGFILFKKIVHLAVPSNGGIVIIVNTTQHVSFHILMRKKLEPFLCSALPSKKIMVEETYLHPTRSQKGIAPLQRNSNANVISNVKLLPRLVCCYTTEPK